MHLLTLQLAGGALLVGVAWRDYLVSLPAALTGRRECDRAEPQQEK